MSTSQERQEPRLYGHWRPERGWGIGSLGPAQTSIAFAAVLAPVLAASVAPRAALGLAMVAILVVLAVTVRVAGSTAAEAMTHRFRFSTARAKGWTELSGGMLTEHPRRHDLPGPLAPLVALDSDDGRGGRQALVLDRHTGTLSAVLRCAPARWRRWWRWTATTAGAGARPWCWTDTPAPCPRCCAAPRPGWTWRTGPARTNGWPAGAPGWPTWGTAR